MGSKYWQRLKIRPGVPTATMFTILGGIVGALNENFNLVEGILFGVVLSSIFTWPIVLWTARTQPLPKESSQEKGD